MNRSNNQRTKLSKPSSISNAKMPEKAIAKKRNRYLEADDDDDSQSFDEYEDNNEGDIDFSDESEGKKANVVNVSQTKVVSKKRDALYSTCMIPPLKSNHRVIVNEGELQKLSGLFLSGVYRRRSSIYKSLPTELEFIRQIDDTARALIPTFIFKCFFKLPAEAFYQLYVIMVDDSVVASSATTTSKALSQKAFFEWKDYTTEPRQRTVKRFSRVLTSAYRWHDTFTNERSSFLQGLISNLEKPSPVVFLDSLTFVYGGHFSYKKSRMSAYFVTVFGEKPDVEYVPKDQEEEYLEDLESG